MVVSSAKAVGAASANTITSASRIASSFFMLFLLKKMFPMYPWIGSDPIYALIVPESAINVNRVLKVFFSFLAL